MRYYGESNVPGAPGIQFAGGNFMGGEGSAINPEALKRDARQQKIYNKGINTDNPNEKEIFLRRTGPQLPLAGGFPDVGNVGGVMAQVTPFNGPGDTLNMGPLPGDYSKMPIIPDPAEEQYQRDRQFEEYRIRAFPQQIQMNTVPQYLTQQKIPQGFAGKFVT